MRTVYHFANTHTHTRLFIVFANKRLEQTHWHTRQTRILAKHDCLLVRIIVNVCERARRKKK